MGSPRRLDAKRRTSWGEPRGVTIPSPNIWDSPEIYELENLGVDRAGVIETAMREVHDWAGRDVLDIGCGTGFHLPRFAATARTVIGVEPHPPLVVRARRRVAALPSVRLAAQQDTATKWYDRIRFEGDGPDVLARVAQREAVEALALPHVDDLELLLVGTLHVEARAVG